MQMDGIHKPVLCTWAMDCGAIYDLLALWFLELVFNIWKEDQDCYMHFVAFRWILSTFAFHLIISAQNSDIWFDYIQYFLVIF